ncbi:aldehyde dehydrogenase family protein [Novosphingobium sp. KACC 22771]|uniref:aldehyde dehydrogenase family protein n=1 Tax=Novosphingobium sp. KACC 22771 TaxID=3025670 RepID=UPI0023663E2E|nr:aldehyde dehydrogenase family protein [Novosphingobium sp. KACC 22771]WDF74357.1 aldehyde dehydrogenase family protein [Novosphingobium sp. KACC 22771]
MSVFKGQNFIDGAWRDSSVQVETINPSDLDETVGTYAKATPVEVEEAMAAAKRALPAWSAFNMQARADILRKAGDLLMARATEIGLLLSREEGKTRPEGYGETIRAAQCFHYYAGEVVRAQGQWYNSMRDGHNIIVSREPVGVVAAITPWNFPIALPSWKVAAALAYGNTVVLKPSSFVPGAAIMLAKVLEEVGLPKGVFNLVIGDGSAAGNIMIDAADALTFTGGTATGRVVLKRAAETMTKCQLELGGKNALVVLDDADIDLAVEIAANGAWIQTGQRCTGTERLVVTKGIHDEFVERLAKAAAAYRVGHALDADTQIGPVANEPQFKGNLEFVADAKYEGAEVAFGGTAVEARTRGLYMAPTLLVNTRTEWACNQHESFGPIVSVVKVEDLDEAIASANACDYKLSAGIATTNLKNAERFRRASQAGMVMVNAPTAGLEYHVPLGGRSPSGYGPRETGAASAEFFTESKTSYINHGAI